jgi:hypothetical protein
MQVTGRLAWRFLAATKSRRNTVRLLPGRYSLSGDSLKRILVGGVFRVEICRAKSAVYGPPQANDGARLDFVDPGLWKPSLGRSGMKDATRKAASEALAQLLAVTAMVVIAGFVLYSH